MTETSQHVVVAAFDSTPLVLFTNLLNLALKTLKRPIDFGDSLSELVRLENDSSAAATGELRVILYPSDAFLRLAATLFAGDCDFGAIEDTAHE